MHSFQLPASASSAENLGSCHACATQMKFLVLGLSIWGMKQKMGSVRMFLNYGTARENDAKCFKKFELVRIFKTKSLRYRKQMQKW